ncbi:MAG: hypothetical protein SVV67_08715 [Bacillota bacterium]|nr:hypothetical protein [Bacillota bacterium]
MAFAYSILTEITTIAAATAAVYTNPAGTKAYIRTIILYNGNTTTETVMLWNVPDNTGAVGTAGATNKFYEQEIAPNQTVFIEFAAPGLILEDENDTIQADADTASKVTIQIMGATE